MFCRWHILPEKLSKTYLGASNKFWKCKHSVGTFFHLWWAYNKAKHFWERVCKILQQILKCSILLEPEIFLSIIPTEYSKDMRYVLLHIMTAARIIYAQMWKNLEIAVTDMLVKKIFEIVLIDDLS